MAIGIVKWELLTDSTKITAYFQANQLYVIRVLIFLFEIGCISRILQCKIDSMQFLKNLWNKGFLKGVFFTLKVNGFIRRSTSKYLKTNSCCKKSKLIDSMSIRNFRFLIWGRRPRNISTDSLFLKVPMLITVPQTESCCHCFFSSFSESKSLVI